MGKYVIMFEVEGTPVSTDELMERLKDVKFVKSRLRPLNRGETWRDVVYKTRID